MNHRASKLMLLALCGAPLFWFAGDWSYSRWIASRMTRQEQSIRRDATGLRTGCEAFTLGTGSTAILFIHGFADTPAVFHPMAADLAARGFTCRAMRLPGAGMPVGISRTITRAMWEDEVRREIADLQKTHGRVWLAGHSMGGALAARIAFSQADSVAGVILLAPLFEVSGRRAPLLPARNWFELGRRALVFTETLELAFPRDVHNETARQFDMRDEFLPLNIYQQTFELADAAKECAPHIRQPVLMVVS